MNDTTQPTIHKPVLINEVLEYLNPQPNKVYLDVTFGGGGHTRAILEHEPTCKVVAMDWDDISLETYSQALKEEFGERFSTLWGNFGNVYRILKKAKIEKVDGILADFGTSQVQIFERAGFSIYRDTPLDMRMSPAHQKITAEILVNKAPEKELRDIFTKLGQERYAKRIAYFIVDERKKNYIKTTMQLAKLIERVVPKSPHAKIHPATRVFQALRMHVNHELENIRSFLAAAPRLIRSGGRLVCISFHSLEDGLVKDTFKQGEIDGIWQVLTKKVVLPTEQEVAVNPSSRSSRLRAVEILD